MIRGVGCYRDGRVVPGRAVADLVAPRPDAGGAQAPAGSPAEHVARRLRRWHAEELGAGGFVWLGLLEPDPAELRAVADVLGLPALQVEDAANPRQRAKVEVGGRAAFVVLKTLAYLPETSDVETGQISVFLGPGYALTVRQGRVGDLRGLRARLDASARLARQGPAAVLYVVLDAVVDGYLAVGDGIAGDVEAIEEGVFTPQRDDDPDAGTIYRLKRENLEMRRAVLPLVPTAHALVQQAVGGVPEGLRDEFRDVGDHLLRVWEQVDGADNLLMAMLMATTALQDLRQNADMRKISAWVAIAAVPTMIAGVYGMNFDDMPELHSAAGYPAVLAVMAGACALLYRAFRRSRWL